MASRLPLTNMRDISGWVESLPPTCARDISSRVVSSAILVGLLF